VFRLVKRLIVLACVLIAIFAVVGYAKGWIVIRNDPQAQKTTIQIDTSQVKDAVKDAVEEGKTAIDKVRGKIEHSGQQPATAPATPDKPGIPWPDRQTPFTTPERTPAPPAAPGGGN
jgi:uncharacterized membrane protein